MSEVQLPRALFLIAFTSPIVLQNDQSRIQHRSQHTHTRHTQAYRIAQMVEMRNILGLEAESRHNATRIPEPDDPGTANAPLGVSVQVHDVPADDDGTGGEATHGD